MIMPAPVCPSCANLSVLEIGPILNYAIFAGNFTSASKSKLYKCKICGLYFKKPVLDKAQRNARYRVANPGNWRCGFENRQDWVLATRWIKEIGKAGKILDMGCWTGNFLSELSDSWERYGVEINPLAAEVAKNKNISILPLDYDNLPREQWFDVITAFDFIEHLQDPYRFMQSMIKHLNVGGLLIVSTGNPLASSWQFMGSSYWYCAFPEHISFVTKQWFEVISRDFGITVSNYSCFSRAPGRPFQVLKETVANMLYKFSPNTVDVLRFVCAHCTKNQYLTRRCPPAWMSAKDHQIIALKKEIPTGHIDV